MVKEQSRKDFLIDAVLYAVLVALALICLLPFIQVIAQSVSSRNAVEANAVHLWPRGFNIDNYRFLLNNGQVVQSFVVSVIRVVVGVAVTLLVIVLTAYPLSRDHIRLPGRSAYKVALLVGLIFYGGLIPLFLALNSLHLLNSFWVMIFPVALNIFFVIVVMNFFRGLPRELEEAATIDGASDFGVLFRIYLPLCKPVLATVGLFAAVFHWNSWFDAAVFIRNSSEWPLQTYLYEEIVVNPGGQLNLAQSMHQLQNATPGGLVAALIVVASVPILLVYPFLQRYFTTGLTLGSVKE